MEWRDESRKLHCWQQKLHCRQQQCAVFCAEPNVENHRHAGWEAGYNVEVRESGFANTLIRDLESDDTTEFWNFCIRAVRTSRTYTASAYRALMSYALVLLRSNKCRPILDDTLQPVLKLLCQTWQVSARGGSHFGPASLDFHLNRPVISLIQLQNTVISLIQLHIVAPGPSPAGIVAPIGPHLASARTAHGLCWTSLNIII